MKRTLVILNLLVSTISVARPIDEASTGQIEDEHFKTDDVALRSPDETGNVLVKNDDILSTSDLNSVYNSLENKIAKTRSLKDEFENNNFIKVGLARESSTVVKSKSDENMDHKAEEKSGSTDKAIQTETKAAKREESKSEEKSLPMHVNAVIESKDSKAESKTVEVTNELSELESSTVTFRAGDKTADYLENDKDDDEEKVAPDEDSERKALDMLVNDESNSAWDLLDDLPASRRMFSQPDHLNIESKGRNGVVHVEPIKTVEARKFPETSNTIPLNHDPSTAKTNSYGPSTNPVTSIPPIRSTTVLIPHNHLSLLPGRRFIVPGFIKVRPAVPIDFRRLLNQEINNAINQNIQYETDYIRNHNNIIMDQNQNFAYTIGRTEISPEFTDVVGHYNVKDNSNAYPYTPAVLEMPEMLKVANPLFSKLLDASEHPQRLSPNFNVGGVQNVPGVAYNNNMGRNNYFNAPQNYGIYKYVAGRLR